MGGGGEDVRSRVDHKKTGLAAVDALNEEVTRKTVAAKEHARKTGTPLPVAYVASSRPMAMGGIWSGTPIYHQRPLLPTLMVTAIGTYMFIDGSAALGLWRTLFCVVLSFFAYDFFSGVLHVVLDEPKNINMPIIGQPALEFQWHHFIPSDISRKDFKDVLGDLFLVVPIVGTIQFFVAMDYGNEKIAVLLTACKFFMAYFGQYSHRSAHDIKIGPVARMLQKAGVIISIKNHKAHHVAPHDDDFCLIGVCNPLIQQLRKVTTGQAPWLAFFVFMTFFDVSLMVMVLRALPSSVF